MAELDRKTVRAGRKPFRGARGLLRLVGTSPVATLLLTLLGLALAVVSFFEDKLAGAIILATVVIAVVGVGLYGRFLSERYGGIYRVTEGIDTWDFRDPAANLVVFTKRRHLEYLQNEVFTLRDYAWASSGKVGDAKVVAGKAKAIHTERTPTGRKDTVILLEGIRERDDEDDLVIERRFEGSFPHDETEAVEAEIAQETELLELVVLFPKERPPQRAWLETSSRPGRRTDVAIGLESGRPVIRRTFTEPRIGETLTVNWEWQPVPAG